MAWNYMTAAQLRGGNMAPSKKAPAKKKAISKKPAAKKPAEAKKSILKASHKETKPALVEAKNKKENIKAQVETKSKIQKELAAKVTEKSVIAPESASFSAEMAPEIDLAEILASAGPMNQLIKKWIQLYEQSKKKKPAAYNMTEAYEPKTPIQHKILGWGYIIEARENRIDVLFKDGMRTLISNFKG